MTSRVITFSPRRSPHDEALVNAINDDCDLADGIVWPELNEPADWPENDEEWANRDFAGIPEFRTDGEGVGTPEFREALEAHFRIIRASCRFALAVLGNSRSELIAMSAPRGFGKPLPPQCVIWKPKSRANHRRRGFTKAARRACDFTHAV